MISIGIGIDLMIRLTEMGDVVYTNRRLVALSQFNHTQAHNEKQHADYHYAQC